MTFRGVIPSVLHRLAPTTPCVSAESASFRRPGPQAGAAFPYLHSPISVTEALVETALASLFSRVHHLAEECVASSEEGTGFASEVDGGDQVTDGFGYGEGMPLCQSTSMAGYSSAYRWDEDGSVTGWLSVVERVSPYGVASPCDAVASYGRIGTPGRLLTRSYGWLFASYSSRLSGVLADEVPTGGAPLSGVSLSGVSLNGDGSLPYDGSPTIGSLPSGSSMAGGV